MARKKIEENSYEERKKMDLGSRIKIIRQTFFDDNNRLFSDKIGESEQTLSQICSGNRYGGLAIVQKILDNIPEINANWLLTGMGEMTNSTVESQDHNNDTIVNLNGYIDLLKDKIIKLEDELRVEREKISLLSEKMNAEYM